MKTADLQRSKRLKELGWEQVSGFYHASPFDKYHVYSKDSVLDWGMEEDFGDYLNLLEDRDSVYSAPTAGEMIEWLLGEGWSVDIKSYAVFIYDDSSTHSFSIEEGNENALADACAWVLERKK